MTVTDLPVEPVAPSTGTSAPEPGKKFSLLKIIGPGVVTGASDDDPSGIGTYSQAGAQLGFSVSWTMVLTFPLMVAIQEISARVGRTTGKGIATNIREHYPAWLLQVLVAEGRKIQQLRELVHRRPGGRQHAREALLR